MKLTVRTRGEGMKARLALCDADGNPLPRQRSAELKQPPLKDGPSTLVVEFLIDGTDIALVPLPSL